MAHPRLTLGGQHVIWKIDRRYRLTKDSDHTFGRSAAEVLILFGDGSVCARADLR